MKGQHWLSIHLEERRKIDGSEISFQSSFPIDDLIVARSHFFTYHFVSILMEEKKKQCSGVASGSYF